MRNARNQGEIRNRVRAARREVSEHLRRRWSNEISRRIATTDWFLASKKVAGFLAFDGEADPVDLMTEAFDAGKHVYVPMIVGKTLPLRFAPWSPTVGMKPNRFGILEPEVADSQLIEARELDFVITPLVAFDKSCHRIGVGGGFYDRSFAFLREGISGARLVGFAFELQQVDEIKRNHWDVPLAAVATEVCLYQP